MGSRRDHTELLAGEAARLNSAVGLHSQRRRSSFENHAALVQMLMLFQSTSPSGSLGGLSSFIERPQILRAFALRRHGKRVKRRARRKVHLSLHFLLFRLDLA